MDDDVKKLKIMIYSLEMKLNHKIEDNKVLNRQLIDQKDHCEKIRSEQLAMDKENNLLKQEIEFLKGVINGMAPASN